MSKYTEMVQQDTPRLTVGYRLMEGNELYDWNIKGEMPIMSLIGAIVRVQVDLAVHTSDNRLQYRCPESALIVAWDGATKSFAWFLHPDIPIDSLVGMLETFKVVLVTAHMARQQAAARNSRAAILGPDGQVVRH